MKSLWFGGALLAVAVSLGGCGGGGADANTKVENTTVSTGQALIDLQKAYEAGAITEDQYNAEKKKILNQ